MMDNNEILKLIYQKLESKIISALNGQKNESLFVSIFRANSNNLFDVLINSAVEERNIPIDCLTWLRNNNYIQPVLEQNQSERKYMLTVRGIWYYETEAGIVNTNELLDIIESKFLNFTISNVPLNDKEKVVLTALLNFRVFAENISMNLNQQNKCDYWFEAIQELERLLIERKIIKKTIFSSTSYGLEHPLSYTMRRLNNLAKKTNNIYCSPGVKVYFLNISSEESNSLDQLAYLWKKSYPTVLHYQKLKYFSKK